MYIKHVREYTAAQAEMNHVDFSEYTSRWMDS